MSYVYVRNYNEPTGSAASYTVGFYDPDGEWVPETDHGTVNEAASRVHWLNGGSSAE